MPNFKPMTNEKFQRTIAVCYPGARRFDGPGQKMTVLMIFSLLINAGTGYGDPRELKYGGGKEWTIDSADEVRMYDFTQTYHLLTHFYPIGWSADGKFAYVSLYDDHGDAYGYINCQVVILDVRRDEVVWSYAPADTENPSDTPFRKIWRQNRTLIEENLNRCAIVQDSLYFQNFPIYYDSDTVNYYLDTTWVGYDRSKYGWEYIDSLKFSLCSARQGGKVLFDKSDIAALGVYVPGYLKNPRGSQIVIPIIATYMGWEGPPNTTRIILLGFDLP